MKKKEVFINGRFLTQPLTGVQRSAFELVKSLDELFDESFEDIRQYQITLIYSGTLYNNIHLKNIKLLKKGILKGNLWEQFELPYYAAGKLLLSLCTISSLFKRNQMVMVHDASFLVNPSYFSFTFRTWYRIAIPTLGRIAKHIITVSNFSKSELIKHGGFKAQKVSVVYNSADHILKYAEADASFKQKIEALKPYCLAVSSLSANKNFKGLSEAISKINFNNFNMLVAGGVSSTLTEYEPSKAITYIGYVTNEELKYLYSNASLFIFPSFYEGFGIPPLEAMISGCPVLSSSSSSLPEVLGDACEYCDPANVDNIAEQIESLLADNKKLSELIEKGYTRAKIFLWKDSGKKIFHLIKEYQ